MELGERKQTVSYNLRIKNVIKVEDIAKSKKKSKSEIVDKIIDNVEVEEESDGS
jgi:hypothetical protein